MKRFRAWGTVASTALLAINGLLLYPLGASAAAQEKADAMCAAAETAREQAAVYQYEWTTIKPLLSDAHAAITAGDHGAALKLCEEAKLQTEIALQQAEREASHWRDSIPR